MNNTFKMKLILAAMTACLITTSVQAENPWLAENFYDGPMSPTPRMEDGSVDFGGDGVWDLQYVTNLARTLPGFDEGQRPPFLPWTQAMWEYNRANLVKYDPQGFCMIPGGPRQFATPYPAQFIHDRDRIIIIFEGGGHVWREIYLDGREHPENPNPTFFGHSVGHWEGDTLVVDTVGYNEKTWIDYNGHMHTDQLHTVEYFSRPYKEIMHYEAVIDDPGAYSEPWMVEWDIPWSDGQELQEYLCQENNIYLLDTVDDFGVPFFQGSDN